MDVALCLLDDDSFARLVRVTVVINGRSAVLFGWMIRCLFAVSLRETGF